MEEHGNIQESANQPILSGDLVIEKTEGFAGLDYVDDIIPQSNTLEDASFDAFASHIEEDTSNGLPFRFLEMENIELATQGAEDFTSYDFMSEVDVSSGKRASKFLHNAKQYHGETTMGNDFASDPKEAFVDPSETKTLNQGFVHGGSPFVRVDDDFSTNPHNECLPNQVEFMEASQQFTSFSEDMHSEPPTLAPEAENNKGHNNEEKAGSKKRKPSSRSKKDKDAKGNDKSIRKRKKATETSEKSIDASKKSSEQPPKKLSRTTRRRNRSVNKSLLQIPEDEIDSLRLPVKDLLMLAEYRERQNKETDTRQTAMPVKETTPPVAESVDRTRQQIKSKYKKEERQQPMQLLDALANRSKDLSHYELVIGKLQEQIDREEEQSRAEEEALGVTRNEGSAEEGGAEDIEEPKQDEGAKIEQYGDGFSAFQDADDSKIGSPRVSKDSDADMYDWSQYKSDF